MYSVYVYVLYILKKESTFFHVPRTTFYPLGGNTASFEKTSSSLTFSFYS